MDSAPAPSYRLGTGVRARGVCGGDHQAGRRSVGGDQAGPQVLSADRRDDVHQRHVGARERGPHGESDLGRGDAPADGRRHTEGPTGCETNDRAGDEGRAARRATSAPALSAGCRPRTRFQAVQADLLLRFPGMRVIEDPESGELAIWAKATQHAKLAELFQTVGCHERNHRNQLGADRDPGSTEGHVTIPGHEEAKVGLNVYRKQKK